MIEWLTAIIFVEAVTEIIVSSTLFAPIREKLHGFLGELTACGYCTSVWVSLLVAWALPLTLTNFFILDFLIKTFVLHRLSNLFHELNSRWLNRMPFTLAFHKTETIIMENNDG